MSHLPYPEHDPGTVLKANKRYLAEYECDNCAARWKSKYAQLGRGKYCLKCGEWTYPSKLTYLESPDVPSWYYGERPDWNLADHIYKQHEDHFRALEYLFPPLSATQKSSSSGGFWKITFVAVLGYLAYRYLKR